MQIWSCSSVTCRPRSQRWVSGRWELLSERTPAAVSVFSTSVHMCLDQFNYLGSESLYLLVCPEQTRQILLGYKTCVTSWHCFVLYCAQHLWCDLCVVVLCCQTNNLPTHTHAQIYSPPFLWHFCNWWLMSGDDYVAYCCLFAANCTEPEVLWRRWRKDVL